LKGNNKGVKSVSEHKCKEMPKDEDITISPEDEKWWLEQDFYDNPPYLLEINFCPFCGCKLSRPNQGGEKKK